jgi:hypothetical protein
MARSIAASVTSLPVSCAVRTPPACAGAASPPSTASTTSSTATTTVYYDAGAVTDYSAIQYAVKPAASHSSAQAGRWLGSLGIQPAQSSRWWRTAPSVSRAGRSRATSGR